MAGKDPHALGDELHNPSNQRTGAERAPSWNDGDARVDIPFLIGDEHALKATC